MDAEERARNSVMRIIETYGDKELALEKGWPEFKYESKAAGRYGLTLTFGADDICFAPGMTALINLLWELYNIYEMDDILNILVKYVGEQSIPEADGGVCTVVQLEILDIEAKYIPKNTLDTLTETS